MSETFIKILKLVKAEEIKISEHGFDELFENEIVINEAVQVGY